MDRNFQVGDLVLCYNRLSGGCGMYVVGIISEIDSRSIHAFTIKHRGDDDTFYMFWRADEIIMKLPNLDNLKHPTIEDVYNEIGNQFYRGGPQCPVDPGRVETNSYYDEIDRDDLKKMRWG